MIVDKVMMPIFRAAGAGVTVPVAPGWSSLLPHIPSLTLGVNPLATSLGPFPELSGFGMFAVNTEQYKVNLYPRSSEIAVAKQAGEATLGSSANMGATVGCCIASSVLTNSSLPLNSWSTLIEVVGVGASRNLANAYLGFDLCFVSTRPEALSSQAPDCTELTIPWPDAGFVLGGNQSPYGGTQSQGVLYMKGLSDDARSAINAYITGTDPSIAGSHSIIDLGIAAPLANYLQLRLTDCTFSQVIGGGIATPPLVNDTAVITAHALHVGRYVQDSTPSLSPVATSMKMRVTEQPMGAWLSVPGGFYQVGRYASSLGADSQVAGVGANLQATQIGRYPYTSAVAPIPIGTGAVVFRAWNQVIAPQPNVTLTAKISVW